MGLCVMVRHLSDIRPEDLKKAFRIASLFLVAWCLPIRCWAKANSLLAALAPTISPGTARADMRRLPSELSSWLGTASHQAAWRRLRAEELIDALLVLRVRRPGGWEPQVRLSGTSRIEAALAAQKGVILWVTPSAGSTLVTKMAFYRSGYAVHHLSRPQHGFSVTPFGIRYFNPLWRGAEDRYLAERIVFDKENPAPAMRRLLRVLGSNGIVSITVTADASTTAELPFLRGFISMPLGPARLSLMSGSPLLPVFTVQRAAGAFDVNIGPRLEAGDDPDPAATARALLSDYLAALGPHVEAKPASWQGWWYMRSRRSDSCSLG